MAVDDTGRIKRLDEYYIKRWDDGIPEQEYVVMKGDSMKGS